MRIEAFQMERVQSLYEHDVDCNLTESGVLPLTLRELVGGAAVEEELLHESLGYTQTGGSLLLRERVAAWYPGATADNVGITNGGSEANYCIFWSLLESGQRAAIMLPNYMQTWGLARAYAAADAFHLRMSSGPDGWRWVFDLDELKAAVTPETKLILVTNPNNPTGAVMTEHEMDAVIEVAARAKAWLVADEIYRGTEITREVETPTFWGRYRRTIVTSGLSKAFGLPGLRVGWFVVPPRLMADLFRHHDYISIMHSRLSDRLATIALEPARRAELLARGRRIIKANLPVLERWIRARSAFFDYARPAAGAFAYVRSRLPVSTRRLAERMRLEQSLLVVPGELFGAGRGFRFGTGHRADEMLEGLQRADRVLSQVASAV